MDPQTTSVGFFGTLFIMAKLMLVLFALAFAVAFGALCAWGIFTGNWKPVEKLQQAWNWVLRTKRDNREPAGPAQPVNKEN